MRHSSEVCHHRHALPGGAALRLNSTPFAVFTNKEVLRIIHAYDMGATSEASPPLRHHRQWVDAAHISDKSNGTRTRCALSCEAKCNHLKNMLHLFTHPELTSLNGNQRERDNTRRETNRKIVLCAHTITRYAHIVRFIGNNPRKAVKPRHGHLRASDGIVNVRHKKSRPTSRPSGSAQKTKI